MVINKRQVIALMALRDMGRVKRLWLETILGQPIEVWKG